jgi:hypothetical protein
MYQEFNKLIRVLPIFLEHDGCGEFLVKSTISGDRENLHVDPNSSLLKKNFVEIDDVVKIMLSLNGVFELQQRSRQSSRGIFSDPLWFQAQQHLRVETQPVCKVVVVLASFSNRQSHSKKHKNPCSIQCLRLLASVLKIRYQQFDWVHIYKEQQDFMDFKIKELSIEESLLSSYSVEKKRLTNLFSRLKWP